MSNEQFEKALATAQANIARLEAILDDVAFQKIGDFLPERNKLYLVLRPGAGAFLAVISNRTLGTWLTASPGMPSVEVRREPIDHCLEIEKLRALKGAPE